MIQRIAIGCISFFVALPVLALDLDGYDLIDLSHVYSSETLYWPTSPTDFQKQELAYGDTGEGYFYSAFSVCTPEHGGTHLDAPLHFAADGLATDQMPLENLLAPAVVIDVSQQASTDRNYRLSLADVEDFESKHGQIESGSIVLLRTDWDQYWPDAISYLGDDTPGDDSKLEFPSYGEDAARLLVEQRGVSLLGVDTASTDYGRSKDFIVHRIAAARNVGGLENLRNLRMLPPTGAIVIALPMNIGGGSGGPVRVIALVPRK